MVQMKEQRTLDGEILKYTLYIPHGSDERFNDKFITLHVKDLYIPHGSDEREDRRNCHRDRRRFISHMVQMKEKCFRFRKADVLKLYIPHGSDERY